MTDSITNMLNQFVELSSRRGWDKRSIRQALLAVDKGPLLPGNSPLPRSGYSLSWWRSPDHNDVITFPELVVTFWQKWTEVLD
jgi:hypothetical protein